MPERTKEEMLNIILEGCWIITRRDDGAAAPLFSASRSIYERPVAADALDELCDKCVTYQELMATERKRIAWAILGGNTHTVEWAGDIDPCVRSALTHIYGVVIDRREQHQYHFSIKSSAPPDPAP